MRKYRVEMGQTEAIYYANNPMEAVRKVYHEAGITEKDHNLHIEGNAWSHSDWQVCVTDSKGLKEYFFATYEL